MFGAYLKAARLRSGVSVPDAAIALGIGADAIYRFERDANSPSMETLDKMASVYGVLAGDLLPNSGGDFAISETLQPLVAALAGLDADEMREQVLILASQTRLNRNAIARRSRDNDHQPHINGNSYTRPSTGKTDEPAIPAAWNNVKAASTENPNANLGSEADGRSETRRTASKEAKKR